MSNSPDFNAQLQRIQQLCDQVATQTAKQYAHPRLDVRASIAPTLDKAGHAITVMVSSEQGGGEESFTFGLVPNEQLHLISGDQVQKMVGTRVRRFLNLE